MKNTNIILTEDYTFKKVIPGMSFVGVNIQDLKIGDIIIATTPEDEILRGPLGSNVFPVVTFPYYGPDKKLCVEVKPL